MLHASCFASRASPLRPAGANEAQRTQWARKPKSRRDETLSLSLREEEEDGGEEEGALGWTPYGRMAVGFLYRNRPLGEGKKEKPSNPAWLYSYFVAIRCYMLFRCYSNIRLLRGGKGGSNRLLTSTQGPRPFKW